MVSTISIPGFAEPFSSLSHLLGSGVFALLSVPLLRHGAGQRGRLVSLAIFCLGTVFLLSMSGVFHLLDTNGTAWNVMRRLDHAAIFILIASSFTPIHFILFRGWPRWGVIALVWSFASTAITMKTIFFDSVPEALGLSLYLGMGWIGLGTGIALWRRHGFLFIAPLFWGGVAYTIGGVLEAFEWPILVPGVIQWHEVFHVAVLLGLGCHWAFVYTIADSRMR